ncbi:hypothetical protein [Clostridium butyricum]|uniref:hypothetical protein n=1 Tax=Clostridium butyricum TaxID=1492 RepID=UPI00325ABA66
MADTSKQIKDLIEATSVNKDDLILIQANDDNCRKVTKETLLREINQDKTTILNTIGTENMGTTATTLKGAIKEINNNMSSSNSTNIETSETTKQLTGVKDGFVDNLVMKGRTRYKKNDGSYTDIWESGIMVKSVGEDDNNQVKLKAYNSDKTINDNITIQLKEPLRGLPNGVKDTIDYEKGVLTRNIGKIVLNGSESWDFESTFNQGGVRRGYVLLSTLPQIKSGDGMLDGDLVCDKFINKTASSLYNNPVEGIGKSATAIAIHIIGSKLQSQDLSGLKAWLQVNNVTVYYQLATPVTELIDNAKILKTFKDGYLSLENTITPIVNLNYSVNISSVLNSHAEIIGKHNDYIRSITSQLNEKANLSDVKIFTSLADIGLTINDMTTDFGANILKMIKAMGRNRKIVLYTYQDETNTNLYNSVKTWCGINTDAYTLIVNSSFNGSENLPNKIEIYPNVANGENRYCYGFYDNIMGSCKEVRDLDSGWLDLPLSSGISSISGYTCQYRKIGKLIKLRGIITNMANLNTVATLPAGYRPSVSAKYLISVNTNNGIYAQINVDKNGSLILGFTSQTLTATMGFYLDPIEFVID